MSNKNFSKKLMAILLTLISIAIIIIAFVGIYVQKLNKISNVVPDATYSSEIDGVIEYRFSVDTSTEEKKVYVDNDGNIKGEVEDGKDSQEDDWTNTTGYNIETKTIMKNADSKLTSENYKKTKEILEKRLDSMGATDYSIRLNEETGYMIVELSENDNTDYLYETGICTTGKLEVIDYQTGVVLIDGSHITNASEYTYSSDGTNYSVYLNLEFDEEGANILNQLSKTYITYTPEGGEETTDYIAITLDGSSIYTTYFGDGTDEFTGSVISVPLGSSITDQDTLSAYVQSAEAVATVINLGELPIVYNNDNTGYLIQSTIDDEDLLIVKIVLIVVLAVITIALSFKYKSKGFLAGVFNCAFIGSVILVLKGLKVVISISSMISIAVLIFINVLFLVKYLRKLSQGGNAYLEAIKSFYSIIFPFIVVAFVYTINSKNSSVTGIGMTLFWGLLIEILFNSIITRYVLNNCSKK